MISAKSNICISCYGKVRVTTLTTPPSPWWLAGPLPPSEIAESTGNSKAVSSLSVSASEPPSPEPEPEPPAAPVVDAPGDACDRCRSTKFTDHAIHGGRSTRRDCAVCHRFHSFPVWYGRAAA